MTAFSSGNKNPLLGPNPTIAVVIITKKIASTSKGRQKSDIAKPKQKISKNAEIPLDGKSKFLSSSPNRRRLKKRKREHIPKKVDKQRIPSDQVLHKKPNMTEKISRAKLTIKKQIVQMKPQQKYHQPPSKKLPMKTKKKKKIKKKSRFQQRLEEVAKQQQKKRR
jgi:hypothetical protein